MKCGIKLSKFFRLNEHLAFVKKFCMLLYAARKNVISKRLCEV